MSDTSESEYGDAIDYFINLGISEDPELDPLAAYFLSLLCSPPILDAIFAYLELIDVIRVSRVCQSANAVVKHYMKRAFNFENHFRSFFNNPPNFRRLLAQTGAAVSGSNALQFLTRQFWPESDLDLYVYTHEAHKVCQWLTSPAEGYTFSPTQRQPLSWMSALQEPGHDLFVVYTFPRSNLRRILNFVKLGSEDGTIPDRVVQVLVCGTPQDPVPIPWVVLKFHSTCVMNIITHHAAYCLYPKLTIRDQKSIIFNLGAWDLQRDEAVWRYQLRGWDVVRWCGERLSLLREKMALPYLCSQRYIGDEYCWTIKHAPMDGIPDYEFITMNSWRVNLKCKGPEMRVNMFAMKGLKHPYSIPHLALDLLGERCLPNIIRTIVLKDLDAGRSDSEMYEGDELDRKALDIWQNLNEQNTSLQDDFLQDDGPNLFYGSL